MLLGLANDARIVAGQNDRVYWVREADQGIWSGPHASAIVELLRTPTTETEVLLPFREGRERDAASTTLSGMIAGGLIDPIPDESPIPILFRESGITSH